MHVGLYGHTRMHACIVCTESTSASGIGVADGSFHAPACVCALRDLSVNVFTGPILAGITALTRLAGVYAAV